MVLLIWGICVNICIDSVRLLGKRLTNSSLGSALFHPVVLERKKDTMPVEWITLSLAFIALLLGGLALIALVCWLTPVEVSKKPTVWSIFIDCLRAIDWLTSQTARLTWATVGWFGYQYKEVGIDLLAMFGPSVAAKFSRLTAGISLRFDLFLVGWAGKHPDPYLPLYSGSSLVARVPFQQ